MSLVNIASHEKSGYNIFAYAKWGDSMGNLREVNLELGHPTVDAAIRRLTFEINHSRMIGDAVVKIIHGYGSTGAGGRIRIEARNYLTRLKNQGSISGFIPGECFSIFDASTLAAFRLRGELRRDRDLERSNNGVTFIVLKREKGV